MKRRNSIIGGLFGLECGPPQKRTPQYLSGRNLFLVNGRSAIWLLINGLRPPRVWVPSYLCPTILYAIDSHVTALRFYEVDYNLDISSDDWMFDVAAGDLVIFIDYFGFPYDHRYASFVKGRGAWVLEDACHALLTRNADAAPDFVLFSLRKWMGVPDGAMLRVPENMRWAETSLEPPPAEWWLKALQASILRRDFDEGLPTREWFNLFREVEGTAPVGPYAMSQLSKLTLECAVDYSEMSRRRIDNYRTLLSRLGEYAVFPDMGPHVVPLGFPVRTTKSEIVRQRLFDHQIYPPVHWHLGKAVPAKYEDSHRLAGQIMTLPCDQRYTPVEMDRMAEIFLKCLK